MARDYRHAQHGRHLGAGQAWSWAGVDNNGSTREIVNLLTQNMVGEGPAARPGKASLENVGHALKALAKHIQSAGSSSVFGSSGFLSGTSADEAEAGSKRVLQIVLAVLLIAMAFVGFTTCRSPRRPATVEKVAAPTAPFAFGQEGNWEGRTWSLRAHAVVEIAEVGRLFERHEYHLTDATGNRALLVCGMKPGAADWIWFTPLEPLEPPTPAQAGALQAGETVNIDGWVGPITELFQLVNRQTSSELPDVRDGDLQFGFTVQSGTGLVQARWNATRITFWRGKIVPAKVLLEAFKRR